MTNGTIYSKAGEVKKIFAAIYAAIVNPKPKPEPAVSIISKKIKNGKS